MDFGQRFALLRGHQHRKILLVQDHEIEPTAQYDRAILRGLSGPGRQRSGSGSDRTPGFSDTHIRDGTESFQRCRVLYRQCAALVRRHPGAVDKALLLQQRCVF